MNKFKLFLMSFSLLFLAMGCSTVNKFVPPSTDLKINVSKNVNPDTSDRPSSVVMKIFELSSRTIFDTQDFFSLYDTPEKILGPDLLKKDELELQPHEILVVGDRIDTEIKIGNDLGMQTCRIMKGKYSMIH